MCSSGPSGGRAFFCSPLPRLILPALAAGAIAFGRLAPAQEPPEPDAAAAIELRKSFRTAPRAGRQPGRGTGGVTLELPPVSEKDAAQTGAPGGAAQALGESLRTQGSLHLPGVSGRRGVVVQAGETPIVEFGTGRRLILDPGRRIAPAVAEAIARRWPGYAVLQPPPGSGLRELLDTMLEASGYDTVLRGTALTFGSAVTVRLRPDFVVLKSGQDLLEGETRAISVLDSAADALPAELRELARGQRIAVVELTPGGGIAGPEAAPWRDAAAWVTTMETPRPVTILAELAAQLGLSVERRSAPAASAGEAPFAAELRIFRGETSALVFGAAAGPPAEALLPGRGDEVIVLADATGLEAAIGSLLQRFGVRAVGPQVEFSRDAAPGNQPRFVIGVPGWLAEIGGRRLLITGAAPPAPLRLYLTREGIDIFEYRVRDGR